MLRAGIGSTGCRCEREGAQRLNAPYLKFVRTGRPCAREMGDDAGREARDQDR